MRPRIWIPVAMFGAGLALIASEVARGEAEVSLLLVFPVFSGSSGFFLLGTLLIVLSFIAGFLMLLMGQLELQASSAWPQMNAEPGAEARPAKKDFGGVVMIGPLPIAFGSSRNMALFMLVLGIVVAIVLLGILAALT
ncbi:MAG: DUF131 domain-containing protein [Candidatus Thermoplasmatota archaeon]|nr:DUF131 domain-containing protein [Candidatus Thermoplasmatota archaeon]